MEKLGHAVVVGGSIAGLLTARTLSATFRRVTVLEADPRPEGASPRKGARQGQHVHVMLDTGLRTLEELFPGLTAELRAGGAALVDMGRDVAWFHMGAWKPRFVSGVDTVLCTRPFLEARVRARVAALPNVELRYGCAVEELLADAARTRVTGVRLKPSAQGMAEETLAAELVVDASGRGSRAPKWLEALGYARPELEEVSVDIAYTSRFYRAPANGGRDWKFLALYARSPGAWRSGFISEVEGGRWMVSLNGYFGDHAPTDDQGFLDFARQLPTLDISDALRDAEPLTAPVTHKVPSSRWLHYERLARMPDGFVVLGDAVCAFNPFYAQGMTVCGLGARRLGQLVEDQARATPGSLRGLSRRFQRELAELVRVPWFLATTMDLRYPRTKGKRMPGLGLLHRALMALVDLTSVDVAAAQRFYEVLHLRRGLRSLLDPALVASLLAYSARSLFVPFDQRVNAGRMPPAPARPEEDAPAPLRASA